MSASGEAPPLASERRGDSPGPATSAHTANRRFREVSSLIAAGCGVALLWLVVGTQPTLPELSRGLEGWSGDYRSFHLPNAEFATARLATGAIPLWNPTQGAGGPFLATLQPGVLYPPNALRTVLSAHSVALVLAVLHVALGFMGAGALARALGADIGGMLVAGLAYAGSLAFVGTIWAPMQHFAAAWAPALLLAVDRIVDRPSPRRAVVLAGCIAMPLLASWPQILAMGVLASALYGGQRLVAQGVRERRVPGRALVALTLGGVVGLMLAAPQVLPSLELLSRSPRAIGSLVEAQSIFVRVPHDPGVFLRVLLANGFNNGVPGWAALALAPLAVALPGAGRWRGAALLCVGAAALLASFPNDVPVYGWLHGLPIIGDFRFPYRYRLVTTLALAVTAGVGVSHLASLLSGWHRHAASAACAVAFACVLTSVIPVFNNVLPFARTIPADLPVADLLENAGGVTLPSNRGRVYRAGHARKLRPGQGVQVLYDLEPLTLARTAQMLTFFETGRPRTLLTLEEPLRIGPKERKKKRADTIAAPFYGFLVLPAEAARARILDLFSVALIVSDDPPGWVTRRYRRVSAPNAEHAVFENPHALPRAYAVTRALPAPKHAERALARMMDDDFDPRLTALVENPPPHLIARPGAEIPEFHGQVDIEVYEPERVVLRIASLQPALVILTDAYYPGWVATVDGQEAPLLRANWNFRAVATKMGEHEIEFRYRPASFRWGGALALAGAALCAWVVLSQREKSARLPAPGA